MQDDMRMAPNQAPRIDSRVLRHMMHETIDLLDLSTDHADEACLNTDAAMALTRIDWMLMAIFNWVTEQLRTNEGSDSRKPLGEPISVVGIDQSAISSNLRKYAQSVDRLHTRIRQLDALIAESVQANAPKPVEKSSGKVLHIFGDPVRGEQEDSNPVLVSRRRLKSAFGGN